MVVTKTARSFKKFHFVFLVFVVLAGLISLLVVELLNKPGEPSPRVMTLSLPALEDQYGLHINLLAVTASGGMVDLRLKFVDNQKARLLLQDKKNFPALQVQVNGSPVRLNVDSETQSQPISFDENSGMFLMFPNSGNAVKPGTAVNIFFGDFQLEPVIAR